MPGGTGDRREGAARVGRPTTGDRIELDESALLTKIVDRRRGGFCYGLNGAFAALLTALGYAEDLPDTELLAAYRTHFGLELDRLPGRPAGS